MMSYIRWYYTREGKGLSVDSYVLALMVLHEERGSMRKEIIGGKLWSWISWYYKTEQFICGWCLTSDGITRGKGLSMDSCDVLALMVLREGRGYVWTAVVLDQLVLHDGTVHLWTMSWIRWYCVRDGIICGKPWCLGSHEDVHRVLLKPNFLIQPAC